MAHEHKKDICETAEIAVYHCTCGTWWSGGKWHDAGYSAAFKLAMAVLRAEPEVRALVARIVSGGPQAVEDVTDALRARADALLDVAPLTASPHDARAKAARLRALAGT